MGATDAKLVACAVILTFVMIMTASGIRTRGSIFKAVGNRDNLAPSTPLSARADRAAANMLENLILFVAAYVAAKAAGAATQNLERGAWIFLGARTLYFPVYLAGIKVLRTVLWGIAVLGIAVILATALLV
jgi:uncharacterized MAPEG superfamily protein